jgi:hypothetical protein
MHFLFLMHLLNQISHIYRSYELISMNWPYELMAADFRCRVKDWSDQAANSNRWLGLRAGCSDLSFKRFQI